MKNLKAFIVTVLVGLFGSVSLAHVVVITDIDDTIKESHILGGGLGKIGNAFKTNAFWGLPELMRTLATKPGVKFYYVSNASERLMGKAHRKMLEANAFPPGEVRLAEGDTAGHKRRQFIDILQRERPSHVIFFGDNGEQDPVTCDAFIKEFPTGAQYITFIHDLYSTRAGATPIRAGQIPFVTAGEVATFLVPTGILNWADAKSLLLLSFNRPGDEWAKKERQFPGASLGFPDWMDCRDHRVQMPMVQGLEQDIQALATKVQRRCSYVIDAR